MWNSCIVFMLLRYNSECFHTGLVPESPTFFNSSPFKVLSPQPPKFLKSLLPVKEENKAKKALEAQPLLGQEVRKEFNSPSRGKYLRLLSCSPFDFFLNPMYHLSNTIFTFSHVTHHIKLHFHMLTILTVTKKNTNCLKLWLCCCVTG